MVTLVNTYDTGINANIQMGGVEEGMAGVLLRPSGLGDNIKVTASRVSGAMEAMEANWLNRQCLCSNISVDTRAASLQQGTREGQVAIQGARVSSRYEVQVILTRSGWHYGTL
jgi:hypothetical protein